MKLYTTTIRMVYKINNDKKHDESSAITPVLISKFVQGKTSLDEWITVVAAMKKYPWVKRIVDISIKINRSFMKNEIFHNPSSLPVCKLYFLHSHEHPLMRSAASSETNDCVVKCEAFVLSKFGKDSQYKRLYKEARHRDWLRKDGTPLYNIGRLLELAQLSVARRFGGTLDDMQRELNGNCSIIVAINANRLANPKSRSSAVCDHAVVVIDIEKNEGYVELYDPQGDNQTDRYPVENFLRAWKPSKNFFVSIIERGVRPYTPHPEYVAHIKLPAETASIADILAENAHEIWAKNRLQEAEKNKTKGKDVNPYDDPFMKPFNELSKQKRKTDYLSALNTIKLLYKLGFGLTKIDKESAFDYKPNTRMADGRYIPNPINVDDVVLPKDIAALTEYIAENTHEEWAKQRLKEGWTFASKTNKKRKQSFDLVPYCELLDKEKEYDRKMAMNTLKVLCKYGYVVERK